MTTSLHILYSRFSPFRRIDFANATEEDLKNLADACDPATFGRNEEDVLDETYRKAGKLDKIHFATDFDPNYSGLMANIHDTILEGHSKDTSVLCELYKLNVYGT